MSDNYKTPPATPRGECPWAPQRAKPKARVPSGNAVRKLTFDEPLETPTRFALPAAATPNAPFKSGSFRENTMCDEFSRCLIFDEPDYYQ